MRSVTVLRPGARRVKITADNIGRLRGDGEVSPYVESGDDVFLTSHYVSVPWIDTLGTWKVADLVPDSQLARLWEYNWVFSRKGH